MRAPSRFEERRRLPNYYYVILLENRYPALPFFKHNIVAKSWFDICYNSNIPLKKASNIVFQYFSKIRDVKEVYDTLSLVRYC